MFEELKKIPTDPIFALLAEYEADPNPQKVNLGIGIYSTPEGKPYVFPSIQKAFREVDEENFNYQPINGNREFLNSSCDFLLGAAWHEKVALQATCGGTQACRLFGDLAFEAKGKIPIYIGTPTWSNHFDVFKALDIRKFNHLSEGGEVNFTEYKRVSENAEKGAILMLHGGLTHNPSGKNLSLEQIKELIPIWKERQIFIFIDHAYLGFGLGLEEDKKFAKICFENLEQVALSLSFSKNASLYEHRTGVLMIKDGDKEAVASQLGQLARESISMAPGIGQEIMLNIFKNHLSQWEAELEEVRQDIEERKLSLLDGLGESFASALTSRGMFGLLPFTPEQVQKLKSEYSIYLPNNARINFAGIPKKAIEYLREGFGKV